MPLHKKRVWVIDPTEYTPETLAPKMIAANWCSCNGWRIGRYLFLNDQTSADGAFEVAVVKVPNPESGWWYQVESITFGWFEGTPFGETAQEKAVRVIRDLVEGKSDTGTEKNVAYRIDPVRYETPEEHGHCGHCR